jgi:hypothetical protein
MLFRLSVRHLEKISFCQLITEHSKPAIVQSLDFKSNFSRLSYYKSILEEILLIGGQPLNPLVLIKLDFGASRNSRSTSRTAKERRQGSL